MHLVSLNVVESGHGVTGEAKGLAMSWRRRSPRFYNGSASVHVDDILRYMCCVAMVSVEFRRISF